MDHAIKDLKHWLELTIDELMQEWVSEEYKVLSDCPMFKEAVTYRKTINYLYEATYSPEHAEELMLGSVENMLKRQLAKKGFDKYM